MTIRIGRRTALALTGAAALHGPARAQAKEIEIALLVPMTGPWAREGILERMGAEMAVDDVNNSGGIKSLGGAKLKLLIFDTQDTAEKAKDAAQRMLSEHPALVGGIGCWLSTFTLAATEVTERAQLPWLTLSYSDAITGRGFHFVFQTSPTAIKQAEDIVPIVMNLAQATTHKRPTKVAIIGDNTAASVSFLKPIRDHILKDEKLTAVVDKIYTPPLA
ncbi:MAG: ABC transporter substrate-binding protein, partial [Acetobacteraceae bacterium]